MVHPRQDQATRKATAMTAQPFAVILTCADSRVAPEIIFDQGIGDLFTVRVAGNVANGDEIASVEYEVKKFLRHKRITTTQIYAETSLHGMSENYIRALAGKGERRAASGQA